MRQLIQDSFFIVESVEHNYQVVRLVKSDKKNY